MVSATAVDFEPLAPITFSLWGEGGPAPDQSVGTIPTTTDSAGSASIQYAVDPNAHTRVTITASQTLTAAQTSVVLNCPDPTPVPPNVTIAFTTYPGEPDLCQATVNLANAQPNTIYSLEIRIQNGIPVLGDVIVTNGAGSASYVMPTAIWAGDENIEAVADSGSGPISSGVLPIAC